MRAKPEDLPVLQVHLDVPTGNISVKLPVKGAKWQGKFKTLADATRSVATELPAPFYIDFRVKRD